MTAIVKHAFVSVVPDDPAAAAAGQVTPSNWNATHTVSGVVTQVNTGTGLTGGPITDTGTVALANTTVSPGAYTSANITVDAQGRITTAANGSGGGTFTGVGVPVFGNIIDAQAAVIPSNINAIQVLGYNTPGDNGGGAYARVSSLPVPYAGDGTFAEAPTIPPGFASNGIPVLCFSSTPSTQPTPGGLSGPTIKPIPAGCLVFIAVMSGTDTPALTFVDSVGNTYTQAVLQTGSGVGKAAIYYCANPLAMPVGTTFDTSAITDPTFSTIHVYCVPAFTGAVLDKTAAQFAASSAGTVSLTTAALTAAPQLVIGVLHGNAFFGGPTLVSTPPAGWLDLMPPINGRNCINCTIVNSAAAVTYNPTFGGGTQPTNTIIATFKSSPVTTLTNSFWKLQPTAPVHTAQYGIAPTPELDNSLAFASFTRWFASTAAPSQTSHGYAPLSQSATPVVISIASPGVVTVGPNPSYFPTANMLPQVRNGSFVSFSTTGALPTGIVADQIYYVQYGTVVFNVSTGVLTFQISNTSIFRRQDGTQTSAMGAPITTSGTQSGTHFMTTYGDSWNDFVLDPGIYYSGNTNFGPTFLGKGIGLKKWRLLGFGARINTGVWFGGTPWDDVNSGTGSTGIGYSAQFQSTDVASGGDTIQSITLITPSQASHFYVNSWVVLMCCELQDSTSGNWNEATFEYAKVQSVNASTGIITFYDALQYNYRSTFPKFAARSIDWPGAICGPATIVQLNDTFDQEIEYHGLNIYGTTEQNCTGVLSMKFVDCDIWGWGFKTGPFPTTMRNYTMVNCRAHSARQEIDKMIDTALFVDCVFDAFSPLQFQSASINKCIINRCKMVGGIFGTPRDMTIRDTFVAGPFYIGTTYGAMERLTLINSHINEIRNSGESQQYMQLSLPTFTAGTIVIPVGTTSPNFGTWRGTGVASDNPLRWAIPGAKIGVCSPGHTFGYGAHVDFGMAGMLSTFTVLDVYVNGADAFCVDTTMDVLPSTTMTVTGTVSGTALTVTAITPAGAYPLAGFNITGGSLPAGTTISNDLGIPNATNNLGVYTLSNSATISTPTTFTVTNPMFFLQHICPRLNVINCTGGRLVTDMAGAPPDVPIWSYFRRAFGGFAMQAFLEHAYVSLAGNLMSWVIDVQRPYTGSASTYVCTIIMTGYVRSGSNWYPTWIAQTINLKTKGVRTITATGTTGGVAGDTIAAVPFWLVGEHNVSIGPANGGGDTLASNPLFVMTGRSDQGIEFANMTLTTTTAGIDELADTVTGMALP